MQHSGPQPDDVDAVRSRLADYERWWQAVAPRLAAFDRLERLAQEQATTPEALAARAAVARTEARMAELHAEADALRATVAHLSGEVARLDGERAEALRRLDHVARDLERRTADRESLEREIGSLLRTRQERADEVDELVQARDQLLGEVSELLDGLEDLAAPRPAGPARPLTMPYAGLLTGTRSALLEDDADAGAFEEFFNADIEHDKSRDWILGDAGRPAP